MFFNFYVIFHKKKILGNILSYLIEILRHDTGHVKGCPSLQPAELILFYRCKIIIKL